MQERRHLRTGNLLNSQYLRQARLKLARVQAPRGHVALASTYEPVTSKCHADHPVAYHRMLLVQGGSDGQS
eukprot:243567-Amphidinium_carterae.1